MQHQVAVLSHAVLYYYTMYYYFKLIPDKAKGNHLSNLNISHLITIWLCAFDMLKPDQNVDAIAITMIT